MTTEKTQTADEDCVILWKLWDAQSNLIADDTDCSSFRPKQNLQISL